MKILLIYPEYENTFWNLKKVLKVLGKKVAYPPLGLLPYAVGLPLGLLHFKTLAWAKQYNSYYRES